MKRMFLLSILTLLPQLAYFSSAHDIEVVNADGVTIYYNFINDEKELEVTKQYILWVNTDDCYIGTVSIPEEVTYMNQTRKVTRIGDSAFSKCKNLTSVIIPNTVTSIGSEAFLLCDNLISVTIPQSLTSIGDFAFVGCSGIKSLTIPNSIQNVGEIAFSGCEIDSLFITDLAAWCSINFKTAASNPLTFTRHFFVNGEEIIDLVIPNSVTSIGAVAFQGFSGLKSITFPSSVTNIGIEAFGGCNGLTTVTIPNSVTSIEYGVFDSCQELTTVIIGDNLKSIAERAFKECKSLTTISFGKSVTEIGELAFWRCTSLSTITIPSTITEIGMRAFEECSSLSAVNISDLEAWCNISFLGFYSNPLSYAHHLYLNGEEIKNLIIPNSVNSIKGMAFDGCNGLISVTIPNSIFKIDGNAFKDCSNLTTISFPESLTDIEAYAFSNCSALTTVNIPNSVKNIGDFTFSGCSGLTSVKLGNSVSSIGRGAFRGCDNLNTIISLKRIPLEIWEQYSDWPTFSRDVYSNATLYVPKRSKDYYKSTVGWQDFLHIEELDESDISHVRLSAQSARFYDLQGNRLDNARKGINIIRTKDGEVKKAIIKQGK